MKIIFITRSNLSKYAIALDWKANFLWKHIVWNFRKVFNSSKCLLSRFPAIFEPNFQFSKTRKLVVWTKVSSVKQVQLEGDPLQLKMRGFREKWTLQFVKSCNSWSWTFCQYNVLHVCAAHKNLHKHGGGNSIPSLQFTTCNIDMLWVVGLTSDQVAIVLGVILNQSIQTAFCKTLAYFTVWR